MVLDVLRERVDPLLSIFAKRFIKVHPNSLSLVSLIFSILASLFFFFSNPSQERLNFFLCIGSALVFANGFFDAVDGKVAKMSKRSSPKGDFLDHVLDRYADVFMVGGISLSPWCRAELGLLAMIGMLLTSYMGTQAQAVGYRRVYSGLLGRADRLVLLMIFPILQHAFLDVKPFGLSILEWLLVYFAIVGNLTAMQRFIKVMLWFKKG